MKKIVIIKENIDLFFLFVLLISLPIAHVTAVQNISLWGFVLIGILKYSKENLKKFISFKVFLFAYLLLFILALISIHYSIQPRETISEIKSEIVKPFIILLFIYFYTMKIDYKRTIIFFIFISFALFFNTIANLVLWMDNGGWPFRAGGFLDNGGGERFGIYATYALAISISLFFTKYKKFASLFLILSIASIVANNTRATFIGMLFIFIAFLVFIYKNKIVKISLLLLVFISIVSFVFYSKNLHSRYNAFNFLTQTEFFLKYSPSKDNKLMDETSIGRPIVARVAMWKSAALYRMQDPFTPQGYGRFLYDKQIQKLWKDAPQNIPFILYSQLHSDFMSMFFSLGIVGLFAFIVILGCYFRISYYLYRNSKEYSFIGVFLFLGLTGHIASMLFGSFFGDSEQVYFYILYAFGLGLYLKTNNNYEKINTN